MADPPCPVFGHHTSGHVASGALLTLWLAGMRFTGLTALPDLAPGIMSHVLQVPKQTSWPAS